jgi:hypothetical protein
MLDGDAAGVAARIAALNAACRAVGVQPRQNDDRVAVFVPTWRIETWLAYLDGDTVDEPNQNYPELRRERDCKRHVQVLVEMCHNGRLRDPAPSSLESACDEYRSRLA